MTLGFFRYEIVHETMGIILLPLQTPHGRFFLSAHVDFYQRLHATGLAPLFSITTISRTIV